MAGFIQTIEFQTDRIDEVEALIEEFRATQAGSSTARRATLTADRDRPNTYIQVVQFDSYESAMENSQRPETAEFAERMAKLATGGPTFRNLDLRAVYEISG